MILMLRLLRNYSVPVLTLLFELLGIFSSKAQTHLYTLREILDSAQIHFPVLLQKKALIQSAQSRVMDAKHQFLPQSIIGDELTVGSNNSIPGSYISFGIIPSSSSGVRSSNIYQSASGNIGFFYNKYQLTNFGLRKATVQYGQSYLNLTKADLDKEIYQLKWNLGQLYLQYLKSRSQLGIDQENIKRYETVYSVIQALTRAGIKPGADSSQALAELSKTKIIYNRTYGQVNQILVQIGYLSGIPFNKIQIDSTRINHLDLRIDPLKSSNSYPALNPFVDYYTKERDLESENEHLIRKSFLPKIYLTAIGWARGSSIDYNNNYGSFGTGFGYQRYNYLGGITLSYNLWNMVHTRDKASIAHFDLVASEYQLQQEQLNVKNIQNLSEVGIATASKNLDEIPIQIQAAEDSYRQKTAQYKAGIINLVDLTTASYVLYRAQSDLVQAKSDWLLAHLEQSAAIGNLDQFIQFIQ